MIRGRLKKNIVRLTVGLVLAVLILPVLPVYAVPPTLTVTESSTYGVITLLGNITASPDGPCLNRGFVWDKVRRGNPGNVAPPATYANSWTETGSFGIGSFTYELTGLEELTTYYYRSVAGGGSMEWAYSEEMEFFFGEEGKVYLELRPDLDETKIRGQGNIPADAVVNNYVGYTLPVYADDSQMLEFTVCVPDRWDGESQILVHVDYCSTSNQTGKVTFWRLIWDYATPNVGEVIPALPGNSANASRYFYSENTYELYQDWLVLDYDVRPADPVRADDVMTLKLRREKMGGQFTDADTLVMFAVDVLFARGDFLADPDGNILIRILELIEEGIVIGGDSVALYFLAFVVLAVGLMIACYAFKKPVLGFGAAGGWLLLGFYSYGYLTDLGVIYWGVRGALFFICMGLVFVSVFEAMGQRGKREIGDDYEEDDKRSEEEKEVDEMIAESEEQTRPGEKLWNYFDRKKKHKKKSRASMRKIARKEARRVVEQGE